MFTSWSQEQGVLGGECADGGVLDGDWRKLKAVVDVEEIFWKSDIEIMLQQGACITYRSKLSWGKVATTATLMLDGEACIRNYSAYDWRSWWCVTGKRWDNEVCADRWMYSCIETGCGDYKFSQGVCLLVGNNVQFVELNKRKVCVRRFGKETQRWQSRHYSGDVLIF